MAGKDKSKDLQLKLIGARVMPGLIEEELKSSYLDYAMSVIIGRALPDVRDGLKPVHRRILYAMFERGWRHNSSYVKCAKIVGEVIGNYHPHGDMAVYDALVRMAQDFSMRIPLIDGQGNFGSVDGDSPAAYRYTEARLAKIAEELLKDIRKETVEFVPNFDETKEEPVVLPAGFPNLLVNGANGIAVGMATNIPPHNLKEVINGILYYIDHPDTSIEKLMKYIPGPDFPTGGIIHGIEGIKEAYKTGKGKIIIRAKATIEEVKNKHRIVITEIPYQVNKADLISTIAKLANEKRIDGITHLRDESDKTGLRVVIELRKDVNPQIVLNQLFKHTQMQVTFGIIMLGIIDNQPKIFNLKELIEEYVKHRKEVVIRRTKFDLRNAEERAHILEGLIRALDMIDAIIKTIRSSRTVDIARKNLMQKFKFTERQATAILEMKLQKLTSLEKQKLIEEYEELKKLIKELKEILASERKVYEVIKKELIAIRDEYGDERRTEIAEKVEEFTAEDIIAEEDMVITLSSDGFIKSLQAKHYKTQKRGGKGVSGALLKGGEEKVALTVLASTHQNLLFFTNKGKVYWMKVYEIPVAAKQARGRSIKALLNLAQGEEITALLPVDDFTNSINVLLCTKKGIIKLNTAKGFENAKKRGIFAITLNKEDELISAIAFKEGEIKEAIITSSHGKALRFKVDKIRKSGKTAKGIKGMSLSDDDRVVSILPVKKDSMLFVISNKGIGKRLKLSIIPVKGRGGKGVIYYKVSEKNGIVKSAVITSSEEDILITTKNGMVLRVPSKEIPVQGRTSAGVRVITLDNNDEVVSAISIK